MLLLETAREKIDVFHHLIIRTLNFMRLKLPAIPTSIILSTVVILCHSISKANGLVLISNSDSSSGSQSENIVAIDEKTGNFLGEFIPKGEGGLNIYCSKARDCKLVTEGTP
jgi:hypothetical protein